MFSTQFFMRMLGGLRTTVPAAMLERSPGAKALILAIVILASIAVGPQALAQPPEYALRYLGEASKIEGINADGVITGWLLSPSPGQSFVVGVDQPYTLLPLPPGYISSLSKGINDAGVVVGTVFGAGDQKAAVWTPNGAGGYTVEIFAALPGQTPPHVQSSGWAINNRGDIVGVSIRPGFSGGPTVWFNSPGGIVDLGTDAPRPPHDVNDNGVVVGGLGRMFYLDTMTSTPIPPGFGAGVFAVNNHEDLAGNYGPTTETTAACRWTETYGWEQLGAAGDQSAGIHANDINDSHVTVGKMLTGSIFFDQYGLLWLNDLLLPEYGNWGLDSTNASINENGQIALFGWNLGLDIGGVVLLTPIGEMIIPGDVNGDAFVDLDDHCAWQQNPIDLDGDGDADTDDEQWLINRLAGLGFVVADCNANGSGDRCDIVDGISFDCDENGVPDECQDDCNGDGIPDTCEADCNGNGTADPCDIAGGVSEDCNGNGIPDECDQGGVVEIVNVFDPPIDLQSPDQFSDSLLNTDVGIVDDVDFVIDIGYRIGFLSVLLSHGGVTITLIDRPGHPETFLGNGQLGYDIILDDEGTGGPIEDEGNFGSPFEPIVSPPSYTPNDPLSAFDGMPTDGPWTVTVITTSDDSPVSSFHSWGLTVTRAAVPVPPCDCEAGNVNGDGGIDIADAVFLLDYLFSGGSVPAPIGAADINGDTQIDLADVIYLLAYLFTGGLPPVQC